MPACKFGRISAAPVRRPSSLPAIPNTTQSNWPTASQSTLIARTALSSNRVCSFSVGPSNIFRSRLAARVEGKSSLARIGLGVHVTAPTIHAGFGYLQRDPSFIGNPIQLEIWNAGPLRIRLVKGLPVCQLIFEEVHGTAQKGYEGR